MQRRVLSGIQPSGTLHLGNYLGAIKQWKDIINSVSSNKDLNNLNRDSIYFFIADGHSLTSRHSRYVKMKSDKNRLKQSNLSPDDIPNKEFSPIETSPKSLKDLTLETLAGLIASGINPEKCVLFAQSSVPQHFELQWILNTVTPLSWLKTMIQYKEKKINSCGIFTYPVLMASDVLLYKGTDVPVGEDQQQHLDLIRKIANRINRIVNKDIFPIPLKESIQFAKVMSLQSPYDKMSKSDENKKTATIYLTDSKEEIARKVLKAKTDNLWIIYEDDYDRPEITSLMKLYSILEGISMDDVEERFRGKVTHEFKIDLGEKIAREMEGIPEKIANLLSKDRSYLHDVLREGQKQAQIRAQDTLNELKEALKICSFS